MALGMDDLNSGMDCTATNKRGDSPNKTYSPYRKFAKEDLEEGGYGATRSKSQRREEFENKGANSSGMGHVTGPQKPWQYETEGSNEWPSQQNNTTTETKGGKGKKGGKGTSKGEYERPETDNSVSGILSTHSRLLAKITQERREEARRIQWIVEMESGSRLVQMLDQAEKEWNQQRKGKGKGERMEKEKHEALFEMLVKYIQETTRAYSETASEKDKKAIRYIQRWWEFAYSEEVEGESRSAAQIFRKIGRAGRIRDEGAPTLYVLRFRNDTQRCREAYEETIRTRMEINKFCGLNIRRDNGPKDINERALDEHLKHLIPKK